MPRTKKSLKDKDIFTTFDAAKICNANIASIKNWISKGLLKAFRTPGGHYRIKRRDLQLFIQKYNMPNPFEDDLERKIYLLLPGPAVRERIEGALADHKLTVLPDALTAAVRLGVDRPDILVADLELGEPDGEALFKALQAFPETCNIRVVLISSVTDNRRTMRLRKEGVAEILANDLTVKEYRQAFKDLLT